MTRIVEFIYIFCRRSDFFTFTSNKRITGRRRDNGQALYENIYNFFTAKNNEGSQELNKAAFSQQFVYEIMDRYVCSGDVVLDNFSGTGTTMAACVSRGNKVIGIELSEAQCEYTVNRIDKGVQLTL